MTLVPILVLALLVAAPASPPQPVTFETSDWGLISANVYGDGNNVVILAHGQSGNKEGWTTLAETLAGRGHRVIAFDFRGAGQSKRGDEPFAFHLDVLAAVRYARAHGATSIGVLGSSLGGRAAAQAAAESRPGEIDWLLLLSPATHDAKAMRAGRHLYVVSKWEEMFADVKDEFDHAPEPKQLEIINESAHAQGIFRTDEGPRLTAIVLEFFDPETPLHKP